MAVQAPDNKADALLSLGHAEAALGRQAPAAQAYTQAHQTAQVIGSGVHFDASAGLARLALGQGDTEGALQAVRTLLAATDGAAESGAGANPAPPSKSVAVDAGANHFEGSNSPRLIELTIYEVLAASGDPNAVTWLQRAHGAMMAQADAISDASRRQMFLTNIPYHRDIVALWLRHRAVIAPSSDLA